MVSFFQASVQSVPENAKGITSCDVYPVNFQEIPDDLIENTKYNITFQSKVHQIPNTPFQMPKTPCQIPDTFKDLC